MNVKYPKFIRQSTSLHKIRSISVTERNCCRNTLTSFQKSSITSSQYELSSPLKTFRGTRNFQPDDPLFNQLNEPTLKAKLSLSQLRKNDINESKRVIPVIVDIYEVGQKEYALQSQVFDFDQVQQSELYQVKYYQNAVYKGEINPDTNRRHGKGVIIYNTGRVYEGEWEEDKRQGEGFERYANGNTYIGQFDDNKASGQGIYNWIKGDKYEGKWREGHRHGKGIWTNQFGDSYNGHWSMGEACGQGIMIWQNGDKYEGEWKKCKKHGYGIDTFSNGNKYQGQYSNGIPDGYGEYLWADGSYYKGNFKQGKKEGKGLLYKISPIQKEQWYLYDGYFENDKKDGEGQVKWSNGSLYKGYFQNNERSGQGEMHWQNGTIYVGEWLNDKYHGWGSLKIGNEIRTGYYLNNNYIGVFKQNKNQLANEATLKRGRKQYSVQEFY